MINSGVDASAPGAGGEKKYDERPTVRVSNLSEDTCEDDLHELFGTFGSIHRVYLGIHQLRIVLLTCFRH